MSVRFCVCERILLRVDEIFISVGPPEVFRTLSKGKGSPQNLCRKSGELSKRGISIRLFILNFTRIITQCRCQKSDFFIFNQKMSDWIKLPPRKTFEVFSFLKTLSEPSEKDNIRGTFREQLFDWLYAKDSLESDRTNLQPKFHTKIFMKISYLWKFHIYEIFIKSENFQQNFILKCTPFQRVLEFFPQKWAEYPVCLLRLIQRKTLAN